MNMKRLAFFIFSFLILHSSFFIPQAMAQFSGPVPSEVIVSIDGANYRIHTVGAGESLYSIAELYGVREREITDNNFVPDEGLAEGQIVRIPVPEAKRLTPKKQAKLFDQHIVSAGETSYSLARKYGISLTTLVEDNAGIDPTRLAIGQVLNIRKNEQFMTETWQVEEQWEEYRDAASKASDEYVFHIVEPDETLEKLSREYLVPQDSIVSVNQLAGDTLTVNEMLRIPLADDGQEWPMVETVPDSLKTARETYFDDRWDSVPKIALMLPLEGTTVRGNDFVDFYRGALVALESFRSHGLSLDLNVYDTGRDAEKVRRIVRSPQFKGTNLIIGPVFESSAQPALKYASRRGVPIVSPLASIETADNKMLYEMAPDETLRFEKLDELFVPKNNIVVVSCGKTTNPKTREITINDDLDFEADIVAHFAELDSLSYRKFTLNNRDNVLLNRIDSRRKNVFVVLGRTEVDVNKALASISTAYNSISARLGGRKLDIEVVGSSRWASFSDVVVDKNLLFKLGARFVTPYYTGYPNVQATRFMNRYLGAFGQFPSRAAFRGYDAVVLFGGALFKPGYSFEERVEAMSEAIDFAPLQTRYRFVQKEGQKRHTNSEWTLVRFSDNYKVYIE